MADHQGTVVIGNENAHLDNNLTPTVVLNPSLDSPLMADEVFGPILSVLTYKNWDEVVAHINSRDKPLAVYYFGKNNNNNNMQRLRDETSSGAFLVNEAGFHMSNSYLPFGGVGASGYGRFHGKEGFD